MCNWVFFQLVVYFLYSIVKELDNLPTCTANIWQSTKSAAKAVAHFNLLIK